MEHSTLEIRDRLADRLSEVENEARKLREALEALGTPEKVQTNGHAVAAPRRRGRPKGSTNKVAPALEGESTPEGEAEEPRRRPGRPKGTRVQRKDQVVNLLAEKPGQSIPEIAQQLGIEPNYLYRVMPKIPGAVQDDQKNWSLAS